MANSSFSEFTTCKLHLHVCPSRACQWSYSSQFQLDYYWFLWVNYNLRAIFCGNLIGVSCIDSHVIPLLYAPNLFIHPWLCMPSGITKSHNGWLDCHEMHVIGYWNRCGFPLMHSDLFTSLELSFQPPMNDGVNRA